MSAGFLADRFGHLATAYGDALAQSLGPRDPSLLLQIVRELELPPDSRVVDVGCGTGEHAFRLATHFGFSVLGIDAEQRHLDAARQARRDQPDPVASRVSFERGTAAGIPLRDESADLVWCRDVLVHVGDLDAAFAEFARVLRPGGHAVVHTVLATPLLEPAEAAWLFGVLGVVPSSADPRTTEAAITASGLARVARLELGSEWDEHAEETTGAAGRALLHVARLRRDPERFRAAFGDEAYDVALADGLWQVYLMLGKLSPRVHVLTRA